MTQTAATERSSPLDKPDRFVARVQQLISDPGIRAALRSGLGRTPEKAVRMHAVVAPWLPAGTASATECAYYTVAALIASGPRPRAAGTQSEPGDQTMGAARITATSAASSDRRYTSNLGAALAQAAATEALNPDSAERYLHLLVRQRVDGLHRHLPRIVRRLQDRDVPIDWAQLLHDLAGWGARHDEIAKRWLQTFHRLRVPSPDDRQPATAPATEREEDQ
jgi:CRISPR type I-E-associated protein CasB/Cse2